MKLDIWLSTGSTSFQTVDIFEFLKIDVRNNISSFTTFGLHQVGYFTPPDFSGPNNTLQNCVDDRF
jgi:hypothetical protein